MTPLILDFLHFSLTDILDILMVAVIIFLAFKWIKGSSVMNIFVAIITLFLIKMIVSALNMTMMSSLMRTVIDVGAIALVVIFQPEIRFFLIRLGKRNGMVGSRFLDLLRGRSVKAMDEDSYAQLVEAVSIMSSQKTGALIVFSGKTPLPQIIETGDEIDAKISSRLILNIFFKNSPLHDGAMIINGDRIISARCTLPISGRNDIPAHYGMRHRAAIGLSEICDSDVVVVSEETGNISYVQDGVIRTLKNADELKVLLGDNV